MKKILLFSALMMVFGPLMAQNSLQLFDEYGNEVANGQNIDVTVEDLSGETVSHEYFVKNNSDVQVDVKCLRTVKSEVSGSMNYFCALGTCLAPNTDETPNPYTIPANTQVDGAGAFSAHYMAMNNSGTTVISYRYYVVGNADDYVEFDVTFSDDVVAENSLQLFDHENHQIENGTNITVEVTDMMGETVSPEYFVRNNSDIAVSVKCIRNVVSEVEGSLNYFCALGTCLAPNTDETPNPYEIAAETTVDAAGAFSAHYMANQNYGTSVISYKYYDVDNVNDTVSITVTFVAEETSETSMQILTTEGEEIANGHIFEVNVNDPNLEFESQHLLVKNNTDGDINIRVRREVLEEADGSSNYFCALGTCLSPDVDELPRDFTLEAGATSSEGDAFYAHYIPAGNVGTTKIRYKYFNVVNEDDAFTFEMHFGMFDGIEEVNNVNVAVFPNPATQNVQFDLSQSDIAGATLKIYNAVGKLALEVDVNGQSNVSLNVSDLPRGIYLYRIEGLNKMSKTSKLILQ